MLSRQYALGQGDLLWVQGWRGHAQMTGCCGDPRGMIVTGMRESDAAAKD
jgi:hypothetical protein